MYILLIYWLIFYRFLYLLVLIVKFLFFKLIVDFSTANRKSNHQLFVWLSRTAVYIFEALIESYRDRELTETSELKDVVQIMHSFLM